MLQHYISTSWDVFTQFVDINETELAEFKKMTKDGTIVYTIPSEESLAADAKSENPRFSKARKFGSVQWYKKSQEVGTALALLTSYSSYVRYMDSKANQEQRDNKKLEAAASVLGLSVEQLLALAKSK